MSRRSHKTSLAALAIALSAALLGAPAATAAPTGPVEGRIPAPVAAAVDGSAAGLASVSQAGPSEATQRIGNRLSPGQTMTETQYLESPSGQVQVVADGAVGDDVGLYWISWSSGVEVVSRNPVPGGTHRLVMQNDGNLVLLTNGRPTWHAGTFGNPGAFALLQDDGNFVVYSAAGRPLFAANTFPTHMLGFQFSGDRWSSFLRQNWFIVSPNQQYRLVMQGDGNLVLYSRVTNRALWASGTHGNPGAFTALQNDGNVVVYSAAGRPLWASGSSRSGDGLFDLRLQNDGNLVNYFSASPQGTRLVPLWHTRTGGQR